MTLTQACKRLICRVLIGVLLSAQFAVAAYACPGLADTITAEVASAPSAGSAAHDVPAGVAQMAAASMDGAAGHEPIDPASPHLCMGHCRFGQQSADHTPAPAVPTALLIAMYSLPTADTAAVSVLPTASSQRGGPPGAGDPPHAILHCCFRD